MAIENDIQAKLAALFSRAKALRHNVDHVSMTFNDVHHGGHRILVYIFDDVAAYVGTSRTSLDEATERALNDLPPLEDKSEPDLALILGINQLAAAE